MRNRSVSMLATAAIILACSFQDASACCWFKHRKRCQPNPCVVYTQPIYQQPVYPSGQGNLMPLNPLPQLPEAYFPTEQPQ